MMSVERILLRLEVDREADPITGVLTPNGQAGIEFTGWLGLTNAIESIRDAPAEGEPLAARARDEPA